MPQLRDLLNLKPMVSHLPATPSAKQQMTHTGPAPKSVELANGGGSLADYMKLLKGATIGSPEKLLTGNQEEIHTPFGDITYPSGAPDALAMLPFLGTAGEVAGDTIKGMKIASEPFFSALRRAIETKLPETFTGEQGMNVAKKFAKAEEIDWSKIGDFLKPGQRYNKADLMKHLDQNAPVLHEQMIGGRPTNVDSMRQRWIKDRERETSRMTRQELIEQALGDHPDEVAKSGDTEAIEVMNEYKKMNVAQLRNEVMDLHRQTAEELGYDELSSDLNGVPKTDLPAKFSKWTLPGGANHRELVVTMPPKPADAAARETHFNNWLEKYMDARGDGVDPASLGLPNNRAVFDNLPQESQHGIRREYENNAFDDGDMRPGYTVPTGHAYGDPELDTNRLLHLRMNDRMTAEGEKALHVDELQSDWHQEGRKNGYRKPAGSSPEFDEWISGRDPQLIHDAIQSKPPQGMNRVEWFENLPQEAQDRLNDDWLDSLPEYSKGVPDAPFKKTWHELGMKRALQEAAQGGYDRLTWTTGKQQADRYSLAKHFDVLRYNPASGELQGHDKQGWEVVKQYVNGQKELEDTVGQEMADKLVNNPTTKIPSILPQKDANGKWIVPDKTKTSPIVPAGHTVRRATPDDISDLNNLFGPENHEVKPNDWILQGPRFEDSHEGLRILDNWPGSESRAKALQTFALNHEWQSGPTFNDIKSAAEYSINKYPAWHEVRGADLEIGGEGMKGFYDQMLPSYMKKVGKKYGVEPEMVRVNGWDTKKPPYYVIDGRSPWTQPGEALERQDSKPAYFAASSTGIRKTQNTTLEEAQKAADKLNYGGTFGKDVWSLKMTPEMRKDILGEGQPMYEGIPPIPPVGLKTSGQGTTATNQDDTDQNDE